MKTIASFHFNHTHPPKGHFKMVVSLHVTMEDLSGLNRISLIIFIILVFNLIIQFLLSRTDKQ